MIAHMIEEAERCALCGTAQWEWDADRRAYEPIEHFCLGCHLKEIAGEDSGSMPGTTIRLAPTKGVSAAQRYVRQREAAQRAREQRRRKQDS